MIGWNDPAKLATDDRQINRMVTLLKNCPFQCGRCGFEEPCSKNYDHYCNDSVRVPLTELDYQEFKSNFEKLKTKPNMFSFSWERKDRVKV